MCILAKLYHEWYFPNEKPREGNMEEWSRNEDLWIRAEECLDAELFQELQISVSRLMDMETCRTFEEGFRLGAQLMLEVCASTPHPSELAVLKR